MPLMSRVKKGEGEKSNQSDINEYRASLDENHGIIPTGGYQMDERNSWRSSLSRKKSSKSRENEEGRQRNSDCYRRSEDYEQLPSDESPINHLVCDNLKDEKSNFGDRTCTNDVHISLSECGGFGEFPRKDPPLYSYSYQNSSRTGLASIEKEGNDNSFPLIQPSNEKIDTDFYHKFNRKRSMPIANSMGTRGFYIFASEHSYDIFKNNGFKKAQLNAEGVGIPLIQMVESYDVISWFSKKRPIYLIYKFIVQNIDDPPPYSHSKLVLKEGQFCVYKVPFCEIYRQISCLTTIYRFHFPLQSENLNEYEITDCYDYKNYSTSVDGYEMTWEGSLELSLYIWGYNLRLNSSSDKIFATYSTKDTDHIPKKTFRCANLYVMEESNPDALGNSSICWLTQVLACQGALIHRLLRDGL